MRERVHIHTGVFGLMPNVSKQKSSGIKAAVELILRRGNLSIVVGCSSKAAVGARSTNSPITSIVNSEYYTPLKKRRYRLSCKFAILVSIS